MTRPNVLPKPGWNERPLTIFDALEKALKITRQQSDTPSLDAQVLLAHILQKPRAWVLAHPEYPLTPDQQAAFAQNLSQLEAGAPLPYILGHWEFYGLDFIISPSVLIPRPETELLVEEAIKWLGKKIETQRREERKESHMNISSRPSRLAAGGHFIRGETYQRKLFAADIGAGSGCIAVSLAKHFPELHILATDISSKALQVARANAEKHAVAGQIEFMRTDLLNIEHSPFDVICANLPYIPTATLHTLKVFGREPSLALDGGLDGLNHIRQLLQAAPQFLTPGGLLLLEINSSQGVSALALAQEAFAEANAQLLPDLAGRDRLIRVET